MTRWLRLALSILALAGLLTAAPGGACLAKTVAHHHCMGMMSSGESGDGSHDLRRGLPACCAACVCAVVQPLYAPQAPIAVPTDFVHLELPLCDAGQIAGVRPPPNLRPPIA